MESIQELVQQEKLIKKLDKIKQRYHMKIFEKIINQKYNSEEDFLKVKSEKNEENNLIEKKLENKLENEKNLLSLTSFYEYQILSSSELDLERNEFFNSNNCLFCKDSSEKKFKLKSFKEDKKKIVYLFKICGNCGKWEKLNESKMTKKNLKIKKKMNNSVNEKLNKFNLSDLKMLKKTLETSI